MRAACMDISEAHLFGTLELLDRLERRLHPAAVRFQRRGALRFGLGLRLERGTNPLCLGDELILRSIREQAERNM